MKRRQATAQRAEIVPSGRDVVSGPATRWMAEPEQFPIEQMMGMGQTGGALTAIDPQLTLGAVGGSESYETPISSAKGQVIRLLPFSVLWLVLAVGVVWVLGLSWPYLLLMFAGLTAASYWRMNLDGHEHSRNGLERYRVRAATQVRLDENAKAHELRKMALEGYLRSIERGQGQ
jgi:hypothetical protein